MKRVFTLLSLCIPALLTLMLVSTSASARHWQWRQLTPPEGAGPTPPPRALGTAIYDPIGERIIIFGGRGANGFLNDLWSLDLVTGTWVEMAAGGIAPDPRRGHNAIYDPIGHQMVVWAGQGSQFYNDIWTLDLTESQWQDMSPEKSPETRYGSASIYDPVGQQLVQFAGFTSAGRFNDTQGFDLISKSWQDLSPPGLRPIKRCLHTAAFHPAERQMIVFGGQSAALSTIFGFLTYPRTHGARLRPTTLLRAAFSPPVLWAAQVPSSSSEAALLPATRTKPGAMILGASSGTS